MCLRNGRLAARDDRARNGGQERKAGDNDGGIVAISVGLRTLLEIAQDETAPKGVCADCAKALLDRDGYVAPRAEAAEPGEKMLAEMSPAELLGVINECEGELMAQADTVQ